MHYLNEEQYLKRTPPRMRFRPVLLRSPLKLQARPAHGELRIRRHLQLAQVMGLIGIGQPKCEVVLTTRGKVRFGKIEIPLRTDGGVAPHEFSIEENERVTVGVEGEFPG